MAKPTIGKLRKMIEEALPGDFIATRASWCLKRGPNYGVVDLQLDKYSYPDAIRITVNVGVYSALLASFFDGVDFEVGSLPPENTYNCAVQSRLGSLMPDKQDLWWTASLSNVHQVAREIAGLIVQYGTPYIMSNLDDKSLVGSWSSLLSEFPKGLGYKELRFLAALACSVNDKDIMNKALGALQEQWAGKEMVLNLGSFIKNLREHGLDVKPVLSESALSLRRQIAEREAKKARKVGVK